MEQPCSMFAAEYQGGTHVEVLTTQGQSPLAHWKVSGPQKGVQKTYDKVSPPSGQANPAPQGNAYLVGAQVHDAVTLSPA